MVTNARIHSDDTRPVKLTGMVLPVDQRIILIVGLTGAVIFVVLVRVLTGRPASNI